MVMSALTVMTTIMTLLSLAAVGAAVDPAMSSALLGAYLPKWYLHSNEEYFSMHIENDYLGCCERVDNATLKLTNDGCKYGAKTQLQVIANAVELTDDDGAQVVDLVYYVFYPYNGVIGIINFINQIIDYKLIDIGEHYYDMEHVTIRIKGRAVDLANRLPPNPAASIAEPYRVLFSIHSGYMWFNWSDVVREPANSTTLVVFSAKGSHASYPYKGKFTRFHGVANDVCNYGSSPTNISVIQYDAANPLFQYTSVEDGDTGRNWNRKEFAWGESPAFSSYKGAFKSLNDQTSASAADSSRDFGAIVILSILSILIWG